MSAHGIDIVRGGDFTNATLRARAEEIDGVHFHWPENLWDGRRSLTRLRQIFGFTRYCRLAHRLGLRILWTVHNHERHEDARWVDRIGLHALARTADLVIVHSEWSRDHIARSLRPSGRVVVMPHGNFRGYYHPQQSPAQTRASLGLSPDRPVCGLVGMVRPYRGHETALAALRHLGNRVQLLIAGRPSDEAYGRHVSALARSAGAVCRLARMDDTQYAEAVQACDVLLLPYAEITGSGALLAAWSLERPVVTSDLPYFREMAPDDPAAGAIADEATPEGLARAILRVLQFPAEHRRNAARAACDRYDWHCVVGVVAESVMELGRVRPGTRDPRTAKGA
jgi:glycosyltransferase involved in cell wall biosynthesis